MPRKMAGRLMITIELSRVAMKAPRVVFDRAVHLYRSSRCSLLTSSNVNVNVKSMTTRRTGSAEGAAG
jgi:hypothetical protein